MQHDRSEAFFTLVVTSVTIGELVRTNVASPSHIVPLSGLDKEAWRVLFGDENIFDSLFVYFVVSCCELFVLIDYSYNPKSNLKVLRVYRSIGRLCKTTYIC